MALSYQTKSKTTKLASIAQEPKNLHISVKVFEGSEATVHAQKRKGNGSFNI